MTESLYLPTDILRLVFDEVDDYDGVIVASHVSQHWRLSARSHNLYSVDFSVQITQSSDIAGQLQSSTRRLKSAPIPLDLKITITIQDAADHPSWPELVGALARTITSPGIRNISFYADGVYLDAVMEKFCDTPAPLLEKLSLVAEPTPNVVPLSRLFAGRAPVLRDVSLANVDIDSIGGSTTFSCMQKMAIVSCSLDMSLLLSACPALQYLTLHSCDFKLNAVAVSDLTQSDIGRALRVLDFVAGSSPPSDETQQMLFRAIPQSVPTIIWTGDLPPPSSLAQDLLYGLPPDGLSLALSTSNDWQNLFALRLSVPDSTPVPSLTGTLEARVREIRFTVPDSFTPWSWVSAHRIVRLKMPHRLLSLILPTIPAFCLPQLLEMHIEAPGGVTSTSIDFWDPQQDLAQERLLAPRLERLVLFAAGAEQHVELVTTIGLISLATQVLGLSLVDADLSAATAAARPDLRLVGLRVDEQGAELSRLFNRIEFEEPNRP